MPTEIWSYLEAATLRLKRKQQAFDAEVVVLSSDVGRVQVHGSEMKRHFRHERDSKGLQASNRPQMDSWTVSDRRKAIRYTYLGKTSNRTRLS